MRFQESVAFDWYEKKNNLMDHKKGWRYRAVKLFVNIANYTVKYCKTITHKTSTRKFANPIRAKSDGGYHNEGGHPKCGKFEIESAQLKSNLILIKRTCSLIHKFSLSIKLYFYINVLFEF